MKIFAFVFAFGFGCLLSADEIVLKNGKIIEGTLLKEIGETMILKGKDGIILNIKKEEVDQEKTDERKKTGSKTSLSDPKAKETKNEKPPKVISKKYLESLRGKYDLGQGSYGEAYEINLASTEKYKDFTIQEDPDFERDVLRASGPVMVDFWAAWCGPCRAIEPHLSAIQKEFQDRAIVYRVNIDEQPEIAAFYKVHAIPTLLFFHNGEEADRIVGFVSREVMSSRLETLMR